MAAVYGVTPTYWMANNEQAPLYKNDNALNQWNVVHRVHLQTYQAVQFLDGSGIAVVSSFWTTDEDNQ